MRNNLVLNNDLGRPTNRRLTRLYAKGYDLDFVMVSSRYLVCLQNNEFFSCNDVAVRLIDQVYDPVLNIFKYVHTVDTVCGKKGIMVMKMIYSLYPNIDVTDVGMG